MINLLPPRHTAAIRYARQNTVLRTWLIGAVAAIGILLVILASGWLYMDSQSKNLGRNISVTQQQLKAQNLEQVQKDAKEITSDIRIINQVLRQEIHFSDLIQTIGRIMPPGTVLGSLSLSNKVSGALDLSANATNYTSAAQIAVNLSDPKNTLFSKVDIVSISCSTTDTQTYKCTAILKALFSKTAQTKFMSLPKEDKS